MDVDKEEMLQRATFFEARAAQKRSAYAVDYKDSSRIRVEI